MRPGRSQARQPAALFPQLERSCQSRPLARLSEEFSIARLTEVFSVGVIYEIVNLARRISNGWCLSFPILSTPTSDGHKMNWIARSVQCPSHTARARPLVPRPNPRR
jgi:hypothetical protein